MDSVCDIEIDKYYWPLEPTFEKCHCCGELQGFYASDKPCSSCKNEDKKVCESCMDKYKGKCKDCFEYEGEELEKTEV